MYLVLQCLLIYYQFIDYLIVVVRGLVNYEIFKCNIRGQCVFENKSAFFENRSAILKMEVRF